MMGYTETPFCTPSYRPTPGRTRSRVAKRARGVTRVFRTQVAIDHYGLYRGIGRVSPDPKRTAPAGAEKARWRRVAHTQVVT